MLTFDQVCEKLKIAEVGQSPEINYKIELKFCSNRELQEKTYAKYIKFWKKRQLPSQNFLLKLCDVGCSEIGHLTGSETFRFFSQIFSRDDICRSGNCLYLSINESPCAVVLFQTENPFFPNLITLSPPRHLEKFRFMFSKLFDDDEVKKRSHQQTYAADYKPEKINSLRSEAIQEFSKFLKTPLGEFPLHPYGNAFMGLMFDCAFKECRRNQIRTEDCDTTMLPFAACVKFAFDQKDSGRICHLFGEIRQEGAIAKEKRAETMWENAKMFIERYVFCVYFGSTLWQNFERHI